MKVWSGGGVGCLFSPTGGGRDIRPYLCTYTHHMVFKYVFQFMGIIRVYVTVSTYTPYGIEIMSA